MHLSPDYANITQLSDSLILYQLHQIHNKFDASSTYKLVRACGSLTQSHLFYLLTIFFALSCFAMFERLASVATEKMKRTFDEILLACNNITTIPLLNNEYLAKPLGTIADFLVLATVTASKLISNFILQKF